MMLRDYKFEPQQEVTRNCSHLEVEGFRHL